MDVTQVENLIGRHLSGETSSRENEFLEKWVAESDSNQRFFHFYKAVWSETKLDCYTIDKDRVYGKISSKIHISTEITKSFTFWNRYKIPVFVRAASVILFFLVGLIVWQMNHEPKQQLASKQIASKTIEKKVEKGQKLKFYLPDGSVAWMNAESTIRYNEFFSDTLRLVHLEGMAYFEVEKDPLRPFVVRIRDVDVMVLGTVFSVRSYDSEDIVSVALEEGSVAIKLEDEDYLAYEFILKPGSEINYNVKDRTYVEAPVEPDNAFNWRDGVLYFENASFDHVLKELSRWYGVEFEVLNNTEEEWQYTATFRNFNLKEVLQSMSYTKGLNYTIHLEKVIISHKN